jgi:hypothetical protein
MSPELWHLIQLCWKIFSPEAVVAVSDVSSVASEGACSKDKPTNSVSDQPTKVEENFYIRQVYTALKNDKKLIQLC